MSDLLGVLQQIMQENQQAMKPTELAFGTVVSVGPLSILVDNIKKFTEGNPINVVSGLSYLAK